MTETLTARRPGKLVRTLALGLLAAALPQAAFAATCGKAETFTDFLMEFRGEALAAGVPMDTVDRSLSTVRFDPGVVKRDRGQGVFAQSFLEFSDRMVNKNRLSVGASQLQKHRAMFTEIEQRYGVPGPVLVAFWGLETDFGGNLGDLPTLTSLATLAHDCRRPEMFRGELLAALKLLGRGDLRLDEMRGPWAGELGQTQFLASKYIEYGVDFDGDGRVDMIESSADALASSANYIAHLGWQRGQPWLEEVSVPASFPWAEADVTLKRPRSLFAAAGVSNAAGPLPADETPVSLILPMGRSGPAFLAYPNFDVYLEWNKSLVYSTTAAYYATRLAGAPPVQRGSAKGLATAEVKALQTKLAAMGYDVGKPDGVIGAQTRAAVRAVQQQVGLPADGWPTAELIAAVR